MSSDFQSTLRRLKPDKHRVQLKPRAASELEFIGTTTQRRTKLLYDTTVYIDVLQGRFPRHGEAMLRATEAWHSPVTEAELTATCGLLDPAHSGTREIVEQVAAAVEKTLDKEVEGGSEVALDLTGNALEKINDPVRIYLREMGAVPLLTREGGSGNCQAHRARTAASAESAFTLA